MLEELHAMKQYHQVHLLCYDRGFKYEPIPNVKAFYSLGEVEDYAKNNMTQIQDCNFYKDPVVIIRRETNSVQVKEL
tara:strand:+ start:1438 stop:1668 length:231 start_codon:yes stop_codon:yes gene_type:complete